LNEMTETKYNARMQAIEVKDALNQIYTFTYNPFGQILTQTRAGGTMSYEYDETLNRRKRIDYAGRETTYEYDALNRLKQINYLIPAVVGATPPPAQFPIATAVYNYDDISRLTSATNEAGTVNFGYDSRNRLSSTTDVFGHLINYEYERTATVNQERLKFDGAMYASYNFDDANRLQNIVNSADSSTISFGYDNADRLTSRTFPNGVSTTYGYDNMSRLKRITDTGAAATLFDRQYGYNNASQISQIIEPTLTRTIGYDFVNRLTSVTASNGQNESYNFDDVGNRTSSHRSASYGYQPFNKVVSTATANYVYDANGNMVSKAEGSNFWRYGYDYENRLVSASTRKQTVRYRYDALGRRVQRYIVGGRENTKFIYDGQDVLVDDNSGTLTKYINGAGIDNKLRSQTGNTVNYFLADHLGSTNGLTDASGNLTASTSYDAFGNATNTEFPSRYQFTGREYDNFTGLHYYRARFYDGTLGRFISEDPIGFKGGDINLYGYVWNNPQNWIDPLGLRVETFPNQTPITYGSYTPTWRDKWLPNWWGYNTGSNDGIWWNCFWNKWNDLREEGPVIFGTYGGGDFSIIDWDGYPDANPPDGPFRILEGAEYENARRLANNENQRLHRNDRTQYDGKQIHERQPVKFGGSPTDPNNKMALTPERHRDYNRFWARFKASIKR
jgi:RHS repeat-associated protein